MIKRKEIKQVVDRIVKNYNPEKIYLFGSFAWGKPSQDSDVDLFIVKKTNEPRGKRERELRMKLFPPGLPLDFLIYTPQEIEKRLNMDDFFIKDILKKGKILYVQ